MEMTLLGGEAGSACSWFDMECREGRRLVREARVLYTKVMTAAGLDSGEEEEITKNY
jgi:hypothetical protein